MYKLCSIDVCLVGLRQYTDTKTKIKRPLPLLAVHQRAEHFRRLLHLGRRWQVKEGKGFLVERPQCAQA